MKQRIWIFLLTVPLLSQAENYLIQGEKSSRIQYRLTQEVQTGAGTQSLTLSFVIPQSFDSPTVKQRIENLRLNLAPEPQERREEQDSRGNRIVRAVWKKPPASIDAAMEFTAVNRTQLGRLKSGAPFPLNTVPAEVSDYLGESRQVQVNDPRIREKARSLTQSVKTEFDAVQRILTWIVDHMRYVTPPRQYDALYSFESGRGNCQNYSHLSAALMRSAGIPVRIVNGVTLKEPYTVNTPEGAFTFKMGQGRHSWIEVWFPDLGWIPFDPQQTELFVSNRFVRIEVGVDNEETVNDGMVQWRRVKGTSEKPRFRESIDAAFPEDRVQLTLTKQNYGPQAMLICPAIETTFTPVAVPPPPPPEKVDESRLKTLRYTKPFLFGNLDFPRGVDFLFTHGPAEKKKDDLFSMTKTFMVETAEYVTTQMTQYAQIFVLQVPVELKSVGLALHKFGGSGQLWVELMDDAGGRPGKIIVSSDFLSLDRLSAKPGYDWVDFDFSGQSLKLSPGRYWIALGFTGRPIVNWFYTYGKPVGPIDGTRYKSVYEEKWSGAMTYEFNYRVTGLAAR
ncbi:MAG TPA: hypothetical protein ENN03_07785 [bacterium]|nr:hypothetical protein [bacterium]